MLPVQVTEILGVPSITCAKHVVVADGTVKVNRQTEAGYDEVESPLPALVTVTAGVVEPRYPSFKGIMAAKSKPVDELTVADLGIDAGQVGAAGSGQNIVNVAEAEAGQTGQILVGGGQAHHNIIAVAQKHRVRE